MLLTNFNVSVLIRIGNVVSLPIDASTNNPAVCVDVLRSKNSNESTNLPVKLNRGEISDWGFVASVELAVFGEERSVVVEEVKSPPALLFVVVVHPKGRFGTVTESKFSLNGNVEICAKATLAQKNTGSIKMIFFIKIQKAVQKYAQPLFNNQQKNY